MSLVDLSNLSVEERITRAKIQMYKKSPFFSYILIHMKLIEDKEGKYLPPGNETMGVDANGNLYWAKKFVESLSEEELKGVIAHEVMHIALMHMERQTGREPMIFNVANDLIVNDTLNQEGFKLPSNGLIPERYDHSFNLFGNKITKINEKSSEELYDEIYDLFKKNNKGGGGGSAPKGFDHHIYGKGKGEEGEEEGNGKASSRLGRQQKWKKIIAEAAQCAKQQGMLPAGVERRIEGVLDTKINWKERLYRYIVAYLPFDYSWNLPSKRGIANGIYLPKTVKENVKVIFHVDTSGSMGEEELRQALGELQAIINSFSNVHIDVLVGDAEMQNTFTLTKENGDDIISFAKEMKGGGGTDHRYVFKYIEENILDAKVLICYTDGYTSFPEDDEYAFDTLWVLTPHSVPEGNIPFGDVLKMDK